MKTRMVVMIMLWMLLSGCEGVITTDKVVKEKPKAEWRQEMKERNAAIEKLSKDAVPKVENYPYWPDKVKEAIKNGQFFLGMTVQQVVASFGRLPDDVNSTTGSWGVHDQYIWEEMGGTQYLYFENGILTSWQD